MAVKYWVGGTATWDNTAGTKWAISSGGSGGQSVPTYGDEVVFDANSTGVVTLSTSSINICKTLDLSAFAGTFASLGSSSIVSVSGVGTSVILGTNVTYPTSFSINLLGANSSITTNGSTFGDLYIGYINQNLPISMSLNDALTCRFIVVGYSGNVGLQTLTTNNNNITCSAIITDTSPFTFDCGSSLITLTGNSTTWDASASTSLTLNAGTSTFKFTGNGMTFKGLDKTYSTVWFNPSGSSNITIQGSNTFYDFKLTTSSAQTIKFTAGTTQTVTNFSVAGTEGNLVTLDSTTTATYSLVKTGSLFYTDYLNIQHCVATPVNTWYAGVHSVDNQAVSTAGSGWLFTGNPVTYTNQAKNSSSYSAGSKNSSTFTNHSLSTSAWTDQSKN